MNDLKRFLEEDIGSGDITTELFVSDIQGNAEILCEEDAVVAGLEEAVQIFDMLGTKMELLVKDGSKVKKGTKVAKISGPVKGMLTAERTALNIIMRMSGIATATRNILDSCKTVNENIVIAGTRKTTPGFRKFEKRAIVLGGGHPHRFGLYDMILIKDNHIQSAGGVAKAMDIAKNTSGRIEIEVENIDDAVIAAEEGADIIMIDNSSMKETKTMYDKIKSINPEIIVEISGGITEKTAKKYALCADIISIGALTHSVKAVHFSLDLL